MKISENKRYELIIILLCICILLPLIVIGFYNRPAADDYSYSYATSAAFAEGSGIFGLLKAAWDTSADFYNVWQGLYTSAFILSLQPGIFGEHYYCFSTLIIIFSTFIPLLIAVHILNKHFFKNGFCFSLAFSLLMYVMLVMWFPDIYDGLYWYNGAMNYMPYAFTNILNLCILLDISASHTNRKKYILLATSIILAFLTSGGNHVTAFANILFLLIATVFALSKKKAYPVLPLIAAVAGFIIMYIAPGTAIRQAYFESPGAVTTIIQTALHVHGIAEQWFSLKWIISLMVMIPFCIEFAHKNKALFSKKSAFYIIASIIAVIMIICGMFCVPYYAMKGFGLGRVTNVIWITFNFLTWFILFFIIGYLVYLGFIDTDKILSARYIKKIRLAIVTFSLCLMVVIFENNLASWPVKAFSELIHHIPQGFAQEMDDRFILYNDSSLSEVAVEPIKHKSELLTPSDLAPFGQAWPNEMVSAYYNKSIYLKEQ